jgi:hypothetical protein
MHSGYVPLRIFSSFTMLDGAIDPKAIAAQAKANAFPAAGPRPPLHRVLMGIGLEALGQYEQGGGGATAPSPRLALFCLKPARNDRLDAALIARCRAELDSMREAPDPLSHADPKRPGRRTPGPACVLRRSPARQFPMESTRPITPCAYPR